MECLYRHIFLEDTCTNIKVTKNNLHVESSIAITAPQSSLLQSSPLHSRHRSIVVTTPQSSPLHNRHRSTVVTAPQSSLLHSRHHSTVVTAPQSSPLHSYHPCTDNKTPSLKAHKEATMELKLTGTEVRGESLVIRNMIQLFSGGMWF